MKIFSCFAVLLALSAYHNIAQAGASEVLPAGSTGDVRFFNGMVGIGTQTPNSLAEVHKAECSFNYTPSAKATLFLGRRPNNDMAALAMGYDASHIWHQQVAQSGLYSFWYFNGSSWSRPLVINTSGSVGMGANPIPNTKLNVNGNVRVGGGNSPYITLAADGCACYWWNIQNDQGMLRFRTGEGPADPTVMSLNGAGQLQVASIRVTATPADFVFDEGYKLDRLDKVEGFIKVNKHLPGIPSGKEVIDNGYKVGEMQSKLLQKIEELTLYLIAQDKKLDKLSEENRDLKAVLYSSSR